MVSLLQKIYRHGLSMSARIAHNRIRRECFAYYWRTRHMQYKQSLPSVAYIRSLPFVYRLCKKDIHASCIDHADAIMEGYLSVLGSPVQKYHTMPWHSDIRLLQHAPSMDAHFNANQFFADVVIESGQNPGCFTKDIKVPWELSRSQDLLVLSHAYLEVKNERYAKKVIERMLGWVDSNSFLLGVNWCNPMEVGLRAMSWIMVLCMIAHSEHITSGFLQKIAIVLRQKQQFIAGNFEWYDGKTSNHYLADLVGYLYLSWFLHDDCNAVWAIREIVCELEKQVMPDGASYEGSTHYHQLVTELVRYAYDLVAVAYPQYADMFTVKHTAMREFLWWCIPYNGSLITIGDDDSGRVVPFDMEIGDADYVSSGVASIYLKNFGLSVYKTHAVHCTLRHHAYALQQPTGHFHNDVGSFTLAVRGVPIIVDPGSFVYTPSMYWRNYFRSVAVHNTSYVQDEEPVVLTDNLFYLDLHQNVEQDSLFCSYQTQYADRGLLLQRVMMCSDEYIVIDDVWTSSGASFQTLVWHMTLHPDIRLYRDGNTMILAYNQKNIASISSLDLDFVQESGFYSPEYGIKKATNCIRAYRPCATIHTRITIEIKG